ncbi:CSEP0137 putative effector protein [Blumeria hordei DH14]|uniref:CSEP0137 putative effector protein n=1 Tax=Blumeria graminis f. sp. hordei (strain DH14) TaxID=546991 RepID=N1JJI5_BLUG1|nr:CSEP0137 putative effector protein [Blumeria hordei DH14]
MKLLHQASIIAFLCHLVTVSATRHYVCPQGKTFEEEYIEGLRDDVIYRRQTLLRVIGVHDTRPLYEIENVTVGSVTHYFVLSIDLPTMAFQVMEKAGDNYLECDLR